MKRPLLTPFVFLALGLAAVASAQTAPAGTNTLTLPTISDALSRLGGTYLYDPAAKRPILALTYRTATLTDFLGRKGLDLDVAAIGGASGSGASLGAALLYAKGLPFRVSNEIRGTLALTLGPALLYGSDGGKMRLGAIVGVGFKL